MLDPITILVILGVIVVAGVAYYWLTSKNTKRESSTDNTEPYTEKHKAQESKTPTTGTSKHNSGFEKFITMKVEASDLMRVGSWEVEPIDDEPVHTWEAPGLHVNWKRDSLMFKFIVECNYQGEAASDILEFNVNSFEKYKTYSEVNKIPVFIAIGWGTNPNTPESLYLVPLQVFAKGTVLFSMLAPYKLNDIKSNIVYDYQNIRLREQPISVSVKS